MIGLLASGLERPGQEAVAGVNAYFFFADVS